MLELFWRWASIKIAIFAETALTSPSFFLPGLHFQVAYWIGYNSTVIARSF